MQYKVFPFLLSISLLLAACVRETKQPESSPEQAATTFDDALAKIRADALQETDYVGRVRYSLRTVQEELTAAEGKIPQLGKVSLFVDSNFILLIRNEVGKDIFETKVNLLNLNPENGGMELIPDRNPGEFPGIRMLVLEGKPGVQYFKNGQLEREERKLEIYLPTRPNIERIAPALSQALQVAHRKI